MTASHDTGRCQWWEVSRRERGGSQFSLLLFATEPLGRSSPLRRNRHPWTMVSLPHKPLSSRLWPLPAAHLRSPGLSVCGSWWLPTAPQALVPGSMAQPTHPRSRDMRMKHPLQPPSQEFTRTTSQDDERSNHLHPGPCLGTVITVSPSQILLCPGPA